MIKYHRLILPEVKSEPSAPLDIKELQKLAKKIRKDLEEADAHAEIHKSLVKIRVDYVL